MKRAFATVVHDINNRISRGHSMKTKSLIVCALGVSVLAGCVAPLEMSGPPAQAQTRASIDQARIVTDKKAKVSAFRAYGRDAEGKRAEFAASCTYTSDEFSGSFMSPAQITFPVIKGEPDELRVVCKHGAQSGVAVIEPHFNGVNPDVATANLIELAFVATVNGVARSKDLWQMPALGYIYME